MYEICIFTSDLEIMSLISQSSSIGFSSRQSLIHPAKKNAVSSHAATSLFKEIKKQFLKNVEQVLQVLSIAHFFGFYIAGR